MPAAAAKTAKEPKLDKPTLAWMHITALSVGKERYKTADAALDELLKQAKPGEVITLPSDGPCPKELRGKKFRVDDKFAKKNSIGVGLSARRYELKEITTP